MTTKEIEVLCPCCGTRLFVDVGTSKVLRRVEPTPEGADREVAGAGRWERAAETVAKRPGRAGEKLESALESEQKRSGALDDLFESARERIEKRARKRGPLDGPDAQDAPDVRGDSDA